MTPARRSVASNAVIEAAALRDRLVYENKVLKELAVQLLLEIAALKETKPKPNPDEH